MTPDDHGLPLPTLIRAPFSELDPWLAEAERILAETPRDPAEQLLLHQLQEVQQCLPDEPRTVACLNRLMEHAMLRAQFRAETGTWRLELVGTENGVSSPLAAVALLFHSGGWRRLGRCLRPGCSDIFIDRSASGNRRYCHAHARRPAPREAQD